MATAIERLEEMLDEKDDTIRQLEERVEELERMLRGAEGGWAVHEALPGEQTLPVPRMEMVIEPPDFDGGTRTYRYRMVYRHLLGHCEAVPLGHTTSAPSRPGIERDSRGDLCLPYRDGAHIRHDARTLGWPAFAICGDVVEPIDVRTADERRAS